VSKEKGPPGKAKKIDMSVIAAKAMELIKAAGEKGIVQSELWKKLGIDSKRGSRLVQHFLMENRITRRSVVVGGRKTFLILPVMRVVDIVKFEPMAEIPCFYCTDLEVCGRYMVNPIDCLMINDWLDQAVKRWIATEQAQKA